MKKYKEYELSFFDRFIQNEKMDRNPNDNALNYYSNIKRAPQILNPDVSKCFSMLFLECPETLIYYLKLFAVKEKNAFIKSDETVLKYKELNDKIFPVTESPLSSVSRLSRVKEDDFIRILGKACLTPVNFIARIINQNSFKVLRIIEDILLLKFSSSLTMEDSAEYKLYDSTYFSKLLFQAGCSQALNIRITDNSKFILGKIYSENLKSGTKISSIRNKRLFLLTNDIYRYRESNDILMLMIEFYTMCCKIITGNTKNRSYLVADSIPKKISPYLALGAYTAARDLFCNAYRRLSSIESAKENILLKKIPSFDVFYKYLEEFVNRNIVAIGCSNCGTPYFKIVQENTSNKSIFPCPKCECDIDFSINDLESTDLQI